MKATDWWRWIGTPNVLRVLIGEGDAASPPHRVVVIEAEIVDEEAVLRVHDTGIGIPEAYEDRIFEPFWQVEQGATRRAGGTGLGLTVTQRLAEMLGGQVTVKRRPGGGSTFTVRLPTRPEPRRRRSRSASMR